MKNNHRPDIFDRLAGRIPSEKVQLFYQKNKSALLYLLFGGTSFFINIGLFALLDRYWSIDSLVNNIICWVVCVLFQFVTNKVWVFESRRKGPAEAAKELASFSAGRIFTLLIEEGILFICVHVLHMFPVPVKIAAQIIVILLNYFISKFWVFK